MKIRYDKKDDVMMIWLSKEPVDYAEQNKDLILLSVALRLRT